MPERSHMLIPLTIKPQQQFSRKEKEPFHEGE
jgi:hypothetical protein